MPKDLVITLTVPADIVDRFKEAFLTDRWTPTIEVDVDGVATTVPNSVTDEAYIKQMFSNWATSLVNEYEASKAHAAALATAAEVAAPISL